MGKIVKNDKLSQFQIPFIMFNYLFLRKMISFPKMESSRRWYFLVHLKKKSVEPTRLIQWKVLQCFQYKIEDTWWQYYLPCENQSNLKWQKYIKIAPWKDVFLYKLKQNVLVLSNSHKVVITNREAVSIIFIKNMK